MKNSLSSGIFLLRPVHTRKQFVEFGGRGNNNY